MAGKFSDLDPSLKRRYVVEVADQSRFAVMAADAIDAVLKIRPFPKNLTAECHAQA
ncbi:hypothetical protein [Micromonospora sp. DT81.3]|uniref:hypothetical protein n=1 Tax=Micromonospora sp. DT81.3 TaxID=3416523 RepID=UPI003CEC2B9C